jgi:hypothetical protein
MNMLALSGHVRVHVVGQLAPHAADTAAERLHATDRRDRNERDDQSIFYRSRSTLVRAEHAHVFSDSDHATLLWSTSTSRV